MPTGDNYIYIRQASSPVGPDYDREDYNWYRPAYPLDFFLNVNI